MLYSLRSESYLTNVPHQLEYDSWRALIDADEFSAVYAELHTSAGITKVLTSSWLPGHDWEGTVFQPIAEAFPCDPVAAGMFYGLILWKVLLDRDEVWAFDRYEKDGVPIRGMTYFILEDPPPL